MNTTPLDVTVKLEEPDSAQQRAMETLAQDGHERQSGSHAQDGDGDGDGMDRRGAERAPVDCPVSFTSEEIHGSVAQVKGTLIDLSKTGCQVASLTPPYRGSQITLILYLPDGGPPLRLIGTTVRHVGCRTFGAEFLSVTPEERRRLQIIIFKHLTWSVFSLRRPAFRFA
ncbi:MAG: PilZ domain-containing protein [Nitrospira sp.]|nr:PilZ domain-containing protein [Nitrospira sp.]